MSNLLTEALLLLLVIMTMHAQISSSASRIIMSQNSTFVVAGDDGHDNVAPSLKRKARPVPPSEPNGRTYIPGGPASRLQPSTKVAWLLLTLLFLVCDQRQY